MDNLTFNNLNHNSNKQLRTLWKNPYYKKHLKKVLKNIARFNDNIYEEIFTNKSDIEIYAIFHQKFKENKNLDELKINKKKMINNMSHDRVNLLKRIFNLNNKKILDIGTEDCVYIDLLNKTSEAYGLNIPMDVSDIEGYFGSRDCIIIYDGINIPFKENMFDIVTITMVIHHMTNQGATLKNVHRVMKKGGFLLIKEHDVVSKETNAFVDFIHFFYELSANIEFRTDYYNNYIGNYLSKKKLDRLMNKIGFKATDHLDEIDKRLSFPHGPQKKYYRVYEKI